MQPQTVIQKLWDYGHFRNPDFRNNVKAEDLGKLKLSDEVVQNAIKSYQDFFAMQFNALAVVEHNRPGVVDGVIGPATIKLLEMPRCGHPDFEEFSLLETGRGSWPAGCHPDWPNNHTFTVQMNKSRMPSFLNDVIEPAWELCRAAYADMGIVFIREDDNNRANTYVTWERGNGWIGLAIVPRSFRCGMRIWAKYSWRYQPRDLVNQWARLLAHEFGHNMGMGHTRGGIMNPSIIGGKFDKNEWRGDPKERELTRYFGGVPVPLDPVEPEPPALKAPTNLVAGLTERDQVQLTWNNESKADQVEVHRNGSLLKTLPGRSNRSVDDNLDPGDYGYKVRAVQGTEKSEFSNTSTVTVRPPSPPKPPIPPIKPEPRPWWKRFLDWLSEYLERQQGK